jgi:ribosome-associated heat shock protein Hsp15
MVHFIVEDSEDDFVEFPEDEGANRILKVRLDKWLWAARFFKTRALARIAVEAGKILYNDEMPNPNLEVEIGAHVRIQYGYSDRKVVITGLSTRRRSTDESTQLFIEEAAPTQPHYANNNVYENTNYHVRKSPYRTLSKIP